MDGFAASGRHRPPEGTTADQDQRVSDLDQAASDEDQTASELDELSSASDQRASEQDQLLADQLRLEELDAAAAQGHNDSRMSRAAATLRRRTAHDARVRTADRRSTTAERRDANARARDESARRRDAQTLELERAIAESDEPLARKLAQVRARAAAYRARAAEDRRRAAQDRLEAARERARLEAELDSAHLDDLTGAFRRGIGTVALRQEIARAQRANGQFVIAFVDVDGMKRVNDTEGHLAGDNVLKTLVWTLRTNLRSFDPVVRYGGDEFVCGLGGVGMDEAKRRFETIDQSIQRVVGVGISVGLAELEPDDTLDRLTSRADAALLVAKARRGR